MKIKLSYIGITLAILLSGFANQGIENKPTSSKINMHSDHSSSGEVLKG